VARRYLNIILVMLIGGLWHGASWTFVLWGGLHGAYLAINHAYRALQPRGLPLIWPWLGRILTLLCVLVAWAFFRSDTFTGGLSMVSGMAGLNGIALPVHWEPRFGAAIETLRQLGLPIVFAPMRAYAGGVQIGWVTLGFLAMWFLPNTQEIMRRFDPAFEPVKSPRGISAWLVWRPTASLAVLFAGAALAAIFVVLQGAPGEFIYFQF
jgi:hypothetical protein